MVHPCKQLVRQGLLIVVVMAVGILLCKRSVDEAWEPRTGRSVVLSRSAVAAAWRRLAFKYTHVTKSPRHARCMH